MGNATKGASANATRHDTTRHDAIHAAAGIKQQRLGLPTLVTRGNAMATSVSTPPQLSAFGLSAPDYSVVPVILQRGARMRHASQSPVDIFGVLAPLMTAMRLLPVGFLPLP